MTQPSKRKGRKKKSITEKLAKPGTYDVPVKPKRKINARQKGHVFERALRRWLERWFPKVMTSRLASKMMDDRGIDFVETGKFAFQAKAVESNINYWRLIPEIRENDDSGHDFYVVLHKKKNQGTMVIMDQDDFEKLMDKLFDIT
jgi:hypothetical protein